jgi:hypothetical protein
MVKQEIKAVLDRVPTWPEDRQRQLAELALEIEAEMSGLAFEATGDELRAIDEGRAAEAATPEEVEAAYAAFRRQ